MKLLLDTHCWLWWLNEPQKLTPSMQQVICENLTIITCDRQFAAYPVLLQE